MSLPGCCDRLGVCETSLVNGATSNGVVHIDSTHFEDTNSSAEYDGDGTFELRSTFASCDQEYLDNASLVMTMGNTPGTLHFDKKSSEYAQPGKSKRRTQQRAEGDASSPLRQEGKNRKPKSEKKLSFGWRKGAGKSKSQAMVTLADLAQSVPQVSRETKSIESPGMRNGSLNHVEWVRHGSRELELTNATPESRKSYSQEEESSLSERE